MSVGIVYDSIYLEHQADEHPERPERLVATMDLLRRSGILPELAEIRPRPVTREELALVHTQQHISHIENVAKSGGGWLDPDTYVCPRSFEVALYAAGGVLEAIDSVLNNSVQSAFALVRPPGHHATPSRAMGFCLFNNVAVAAANALDKKGLERILIVDFDVHHGNGTQDAFYSDPRVLYFSTHEYPFYPGTGSYDEIGQGKGKGYNVNVPLAAGSGDDEYVRVFEEILVPVGRRYSPQLVLVSAGYDGHWMDQLAMMSLTVGGFAKLVEITKSLADELSDGRLVFSLEGGYNLTALSESVKATFEVLQGKTGIVDTLGGSPQQRRPEIEPLMAQIKAIHNIS